MLFRMFAGDITLACTMTRFTPTDENLRIAVETSTVETYAIAAARTLRARGAKKIYLLAEAGGSYPIIGAMDLVSVVTEGQEPSNFLASSRILHWGSELIVVCNRKLNRTEWREVANEIENHAAPPG